jgi:DNA-binding NarL/FixJ family response regulator
MTQQQASSQARRKVVVVDDHPVFLRGLVQLIQQESDLVVCGEAETAAQAMQVIAARSPDIVVTDISLKDSDGIELLKDIRAHYPQLPVLMLSLYDETLYAERALRAGARGYIMKQEAADKVMMAIRRVLNGDVFISENLSTKMLSRFTGSKRRKITSPVELLSDRELQVFRLLGHGKSTVQIANQLRRSVSTVETYRANIKLKFKLRNASELVQQAVHWVETEDRPKTKHPRRSS